MSVDLRHLGASERRHLTVVFTDLVDSTAMATSLDPEDWHDILDAYQHRVAGVIEGHGGTVTQFQGDGVISYFGWPRASDTDSSDAVAAGLDIVDAVASLVNDPDIRGDLSLAARVAVHTGLVVVAPATAGGVHRPADIYGEAPNVAARLQELAGSGQVIVSGSTATLVTGGYELEALGRRQLKGVTQPLEVYRAIRPTGLRSRLDRRSLTAFVGRQNEFTTLVGHWDAVGAEKRGRVVMVTGDAGIGKSRLVREFVTRAVDPSTLVLVAVCAERDSLSPLQPFSLMMPSPPSRPGEVAQWIVERIGTRPALLLVEDAHWADPTSLDVVAALEGADAPLLVLATARPETSDAGPAPAHTVALERLDVEAAASIVDSVAAGTPLSDEARSRLIARAGGVPLFLEELTRSANEGDEGGSGDRRSAATTLTLTEVITARLDRLGPAKVLAQTAAVIGPEFDRATLASIIGIAEAEAQAELATLVAHRIIEETGPDEYFFIHALVREAAYDSLLRRDRRRLHGLVADAFTGPAAVDGRDRPEVRATHLGLAGRPAEAIAAWDRAARRAARAHLYLEAAAHVSEALILLPELPDDAERNAIEARLTRWLGQYQGAIDQASPSVETNLRRSIELATDLQDGLGLMEAHLTLAAHYQAAADYAAVHRSLDDAEQAARDYASEWLNPAVAGLMRGPVLVWQGEIGVGQAVSAAAFQAMGIDIADPPAKGSAAGGLIVDVMVGCYVVYALGEWLAGRGDEALRYEQYSSDLAADGGSVHAQCLSWTTRAMIRQLDGDIASARTFANQVLDLAVDRTTAQFRAWATAVKSWAEDEPPELPGRDEDPPQFMRPYLLLLQADRTTEPERARALIEEAMASADRSGERFVVAELERRHAALQVAFGDRDAALAMLGHARQVAAGQGAVAFEARIEADMAALVAGSWS